jgi:hypothetical protein
MRTFQPRHLKKNLETPQDLSAKRVKSPEITPFDPFGTDQVAHSTKKIIETRATTPEAFTPVLSLIPEEAFHFDEKLGQEKNLETRQEPSVKSAKSNYRLNTNDSGIESNPETQAFIPSSFISPWTAFRDGVERVWGLLQAKGTRTVHLVGDGQRVATHFTARDANQLKALADSGAKAYPNIRTLGVIPVLPDTVMLEFATQSQAQA